MLKTEKINDFNMKPLCFLITIILSNYCISQSYNEEQVLNELDSYISNPKSYYDKMTSMNSKIEESNNNLLEVSEEYLGILDKKDSIINLYKAANKQLMQEKIAGNSSSSNETVAKKESSVDNTVNLDDTYRVQLSSFTKKDFQKFFDASNKFFGIEDHGDRNAMDIRGFNSAEDAFEFSQKMRKIGFPGAFVTKYDEGNRDFDYDYLVASGVKSPSRNIEAISAKYDLDYPEHTPLGYQEILNNPGSNEELPHKIDSYYNNGEKDNSYEDENSTSSDASNTSFSSDPADSELDDAFNKLFNR